MDHFLNRAFLFFISMFLGFSFATVAGAESTSFDLRDSSERFLVHTSVDYGELSGDRKNEMLEDIKQMVSEAFENYGGLDLANLKIERTLKIYYRETGFIIKNLEMKTTILDGGKDLFSYHCEGNYLLTSWKFMRKQCVNDVSHYAANVLTGGRTLMKNGHDGRDGDYGMNGESGEDGGDLSLSLSDQDTGVIKLLAVGGDGGNGGDARESGSPGYGYDCWPDRAGDGGNGGSGGDVTVKYPKSLKDRLSLVVIHNEGGRGGRAGRRILCSGSYDGYDGRPGWGGRKLFVELDQ